MGRARPPGGRSRAGPALIAVAALNLALEGFFLTRLTLWERALLLPAAFGLLWPGWTSTAVGMALLAVVAARQVLASQRRGGNGEVA